MGKILDFKAKCKYCEHLCQVTKDSFMCTEYVHDDDSEVLPIKNGRKSNDWYICQGESFVRTLNKTAY